MILKSVTSRLVAAYCLLIVVLGAAFLFFTVLSFQNFTRQTISDELELRTKLVWNMAQGLLDQPDRLAAAMERRFVPEEQHRFIRIQVDGRIVYQSGSPLNPPLSIPAAIPDKAPYFFLDGRLFLFVRSFVDSDGRTVTIEAGLPARFSNEVQKSLILSLLIGLPVLLLLASIAGYVLMRRAMKPMEVMINAAEAFTFNDPHSRLPLVGAEPRIEALGLALNRMLDRLDAAYAHTSRFSADAAHELRTPLTIIRGELELATRASTSPELDRAMGNALEEMSRLTGIVDSLITLSGLESLWGKQAHSSVDLRALAAETIDQMSLLAVEKRIELRKPSGPPVIVAGDRDRLKQVVVNLVDNAIKYTPEGGSVAVNVEALGGDAILTVDDTGIGIDPNHHTRIFDRFYRVSTDRGEAGAGLGLTIVKSICSAHGGTVRVASVPEIGSCFTVAVPLLKFDSPAGGRNKHEAAALAGALQ